ncbi:MAG: SRPBCC family protein [Nocardioidaceae bacterium]
MTPSNDAAAAISPRLGSVDMPVVEEDVFIARPPEEVFDFIATAENLPVWDSSTLEAEQISPGPVEVGTRWTGVSKILGRRFDWTTEIVELEYPTRTKTRAVEGNLRFEVTNTFEAQEGGTHYTYKVEADPGLGGVFGRLADTLVEKVQGRTVRANLDTLAELLTQPRH